MKVIRVTFQIVDDDSVLLEERHEIPVESGKHAPDHVLPALVERQAEKFWEQVIGKGLLSR